jgi:hypothetical protein
MVFNFQEISQILVNLFLVTGAFSNDFVPNINCKYNIKKGKKILQIIINIK